MKIGLGLSLSVFLAVSSFAAEEDAKRLQASGEVLKEIMGTEDKAIPADLFAKAKCAVIIPGMKKAGFVISGKYGRGYASCRSNGGWSAPAAMRMEGGGVGFQIGASETDVIMLMMSEKGMKGLLASKFTLGGEASAAAGPVGRDVTAQTDATMRADILSWSRSRGVFGGLSLQGGTLRTDEAANKSLYGKEVAVTELLTGKVQSPKEAAGLMSVLAKFGGAGKKK